MTPPPLTAWQKALAVMGSPRIRVAVVDDQTLVREGLASLLALLPDLQVVWTAPDGYRALALAAEQPVDVVLMDVRMPGMNGVATARQMLARQPSVHIIVLTTFEDDEYLFDALRIGAAGFLLKDADPDFLARAIRTVHAGHSILDPSVTHKVIRRANLPAEGPVPRSVLFERLTRRERQVLTCMAAGMANGEVARRLSLSEGTVKNHVSRILDKLGARDRANAVGLAVQWGLLDE